MISIIPALLTATACLLYAFVRPKIAIFLPIVFSSAYLVKAQFFGTPSTLFEIILLSTVAGVWLEALVNRKERHFFPIPRLYLWAGLLFLLAGTLSAFIAPHPRVSWGVWKAMVFEPMLYAFSLMSLIPAEKRAAGVVKAMFTGGLVSVAASLFVFRFGVDFGRFKGVYDVPNSLALIVAPLCAMGMVGWLLRMRGTFGVFRVVEDLCVLHKFCREGAPPFAFRSYGVAQHRGAPLRTTAGAKAFFGIVSMLFGLVLIATQSLSGLIAVAVVVFGMMIYLKRGWKILFATALLVILGFGYQAMTGKLSHVFNRQSSSLIAREQIWTISARMIEKYPLFGTGLGTFEPAYQNELKIILNSQNVRIFKKSGWPLLPTPDSLHPPLEWVVRDPHNILLSFWLNTGMVGLTAMVLLITNSLRKNFALLKQTHEGVFASHNSPKILLGAGLITLVIFGLFDVPYWKNDLALLWWSLLIL